MSRVLSVEEYRTLVGKPRRANKYGAKRVSGDARADGLSFDSQAEAKRYDELRLRQRAGEIGQIPMFKLKKKLMKACLGIDVIEVSARPKKAKPPRPFRRPRRLKSFTQSAKIGRANNA